MQGKHKKLHWKFYLGCLFTCWNLKVKVESEEFVFNFFTVNL